VISRDVVFAKDELWDWKMSSDDIEHNILESGRDKEGEENEDYQVVEEAVNGENGEEEGGAINSSSSESNEAANEEGSVSPVQGRNRRAPVWMLIMCPVRGGQKRMWRKFDDVHCFWRLRDI
jgi:hypothetical protein